MLEREPCCVAVLLSVLGTVLHETALKSSVLAKKNPVNILRIGAFVSDLCIYVS